MKVELSNESDPPTILYKYRDHSWPYLVNLLAHGRIWFPAPEALNDPFDCRPHVIAEAHVVSQRRAEARRLAASLDVPEVVGMAEESATEIGEDTLREFTSRTGILSLSDGVGIVPLWALYGGNHRGLAIGFDTSSLGREAVHPVAYRDRRPHAGPYPTDGGRKRWAQDALLTKHRAWEFEREWRVFCNLPAAESGGGYVELPSGAVSKLVFGLRPDPRLVLTVTALVQSCSLEVEIEVIEERWGKGAPPPSGPPGNTGGLAGRPSGYDLQPVETDLNELTRQVLEKVNGSDRRGLFGLLERGLFEDPFRDEIIAEGHSFEEDW